MYMSMLAWLLLGQGQGHIFRINILQTSRLAGVFDGHLGFFFVSSAWKHVVAPPPLHDTVQMRGDNIHV